MPRRFLAAEREALRQELSRFALDVPVREVDGEHYHRVLRCATGVTLILTMDLYLYWGLRTRVRLMHDGLSMTRSDAILRHKGEASGVIRQYGDLSDTEKEQVLTFLDSL